MAKGPNPKDPKLRQRRNKSVTKSTLVIDSRKTIKRAPQLPKDRAWDPMVRKWWKDVWASPMANEYLPSDVHGLLILAALMDKFWMFPNKQLASEIRQQQQAFGLTPLDRRRLEWTVVQTEDAKDKRDKKRASEAVIVNDDPRGILE